mmetsp:Transcript_32677/g.75214  ORF Transcript_32677/g.75214 Transcript_32677/m.75214 type:complete len:559 (-) Transcript_32677:90-1766(-)
MPRKNQNAAPAGLPSLQMLTGDEMGILKEVNLPLRDASAAQPHGRDLIAAAEIDDNDDVDLDEEVDDDAPTAEADEERRLPPAPSVGIVSGSVRDPHRSHEITVAARRAPRRDDGDDEEYILTGHVDRSVELWRRRTGDGPATYERTSVVPPDGAARFLAAAFVEDEDGASAVLADAGGGVRVLSLDAGTLTPTKTLDALAGRRGRGDACSDPRVANVTASIGDDVFAASDVCGKFVVFCGRGRETLLYDRVAEKITWRARNLPPDPVTQLQRPIWGSAVCLFDGEEGADGPERLPKVAVGTAFGQVRLYDPEKNRRPLSITRLVGDGDGRRLGAERTTTDGAPGDFRVTALKRWRGSTVLAADAAGYVRHLDMSAPQGKLLKTFEGFCGSVRDIAVQEGEGRYAAACGLDRTVKVLDVGKGKLVGRVYLKQRMNCLLFCTNGKEAQEENDEEEDEEDKDNWEDKVVWKGGKDEEDVVENYFDSDQEDDGHARDETLGDDATTSSSEEELDDDDFTSSSSEEEMEEANGDNGQEHRKRGMSGMKNEKPPTKTKRGKKS